MADSPTRINLRGVEVYSPKRSKRAPAPQPINKTGLKKGDKVIFVYRYYKIEPFKINYSKAMELPIYPDIVKETVVRTVLSVTPDAVRVRYKKKVLHITNEQIIYRV